MAENVTSFLKNAHIRQGAFNLGLDALSQVVAHPLVEEVAANITTGMNIEIGLQRRLAWGAYLPLALHPSDEIFAAQPLVKVKLSFSTCDSYKSLSEKWSA